VKYNVVWRRKALKQLDKLPVLHRERIREATRKLSDSGTWGDVKKLVNHEYNYRLRVGDYRVLFDATNDEKIEINEISIEKVKKRDSRTY
jgi:mRNA-degrading endonuclease RelE of RelBE toxin-antitoxin system